MGCARDAAAKCRQRPPAQQPQAQTCPSTAAPCRFLWLAAQRPEWSTETHRHFQPRFKRAVQALLLAMHHTRQHRGSGSGMEQRMPALPPDLLFRILDQAAYPLSAWAPGAQE